MSKNHIKDSDCTVDVDTNCCTVCGADHGGDPCYFCNGKAFHKPNCLRLITERLDEAGLLPNLEYPGYISIPCGKFFLHFGTVNELWGADVHLFTENGVGADPLPEGVDAYLETDVPSKSEDTDKIIAAIQKCVKEFRAKFGTKCGVCGTPMAEDDENVGKAIGCEHCDAVFCSADCAEKHNHSTSDAGRTS